MPGDYTDRKFYANGPLTIYGGDVNGPPTFWKVSADNPESGSSITFGAFYASTRFGEVTEAEMDAEIARCQAEVAAEGKVYTEWNVLKFEPMTRITLVREV